MHDFPMILMLSAAECAVLRADTEYYCESPDMDVGLGVDLV